MVQGRLALLKEVMLKVNLAYAANFPTIIVAP